MNFEVAKYIPGDSIPPAPIRHLKLRVEWCHLLVNSWVLLVSLVFQDAEIIFTHSFNYTKH